MSEHPVSRDSQRVPLEARVQLKFEWFGGFISEYSSNISPGGMFIRTQTPEPVGRMIGFELRLGDDYELIRGTGEVVWVRAMDQGPDKPAGMGIRFLEITPEGRDLIYRMVDNYIAEGGTPFDLSRTPTGTHAPAAPAAPPGPPAAALVPEPPPARPTRPAPPTAPSPSPPVSPPPQEAAPPPAAPPVPPPPAPAPFAPLAPLAVTPPPVEPPWPTEESAEMESEPQPEPVWPESSELSEPPPAVPTFGVAVAKDAPRRGSRLVLWAALGGALVVAAALAILKQDTLTSLFLPGKGAQAAVAARPPARRRAPHPAAAAPASPAPPPAAAAASPPPSAAPPASSAAPVVPSSPAPAPPPPAPEAVTVAGAVTQIQKITWQQTPDGTEVVLWADGALRRQDWAPYRIDGDPPRELIKLFGIRRPFGSPRLVVGSQQLLQVRTGSHEGNELHVVLDLAGSGVEVTGIEAQGRELHVHLKGK